MNARQKLHRVQLTEWAAKFSNPVLVILFSSLQEQLVYVQKQLDTANERLIDNNKQIELLTEQIRILNRRHFRRKSESALTAEDGQMTIFDLFNEAEYYVKQTWKAIRPFSIGQKNFMLIEVRQQGKSQHNGL